MVHNFLFYSLLSLCLHLSFDVFLYRKLHTFRQCLLGLSTVIPGRLCLPLPQTTISGRVLVIISQPGFVLFTETSSTAQLFACTAYLRLKRALLLVFLKILTVLVTVLASQKFVTTDLVDVLHSLSHLRICQFALSLRIFRRRGTWVKRPMRVHHLLLLISWISS